MARLVKLTTNLNDGAEFVEYFEVEGLLSGEHITRNVVPERGRIEIRLVDSEDV